MAEQSGLSDARLADDHERSAPVGQTIKNRVETLDLRIAAGEPLASDARMRPGHRPIIS
jgi:hypothetical protein